MASLQEDMDLALAFKLQEEEYERDNSCSYSNELNNCMKMVSARTAGKSVTDPIWETIDPIPDVHSLFILFDKQYFWGKLQGVEVRWSPRMTLCAGLCCYERRGGLCSVRLSEPLLKLRPRKDLVETLLHEMIHAYLFVTANNKDHEAHGTEFLSHMHRINKESGANITVYHNFHDEVSHYKTHWWRCEGPCKDRKPFFGWVKRAMNRPPGPNDFWWKEHQATCGGQFVKVREPEDYKTKKPKASETRLQNQIDNIFKRKVDSDAETGPLPKRPALGSLQSSSSSTTLSQFGQRNASSVVTINTISPTKSLSSALSSFVPFSGKGHTVGSVQSLKKKLPLSLNNNAKSSATQAQISKIPTVKSSPRSPGLDDFDVSAFCQTQKIAKVKSPPSSPGLDDFDVIPLKQTIKKNPANVQQSSITKYLASIPVGKTNKEGTISKFPFITPKKKAMREGSITLTELLQKMKKNVGSASWNMRSVGRKKHKRAARPEFYFSDSDVEVIEPEQKVSVNIVKKYSCPICNQEIAVDCINSHLDACLEKE